MEELKESTDFNKSTALFFTSSFKTSVRKTPAFSYVPVPPQTRQ